jgi:putative Mn2+ efflux pump MntP
MPLLGLTLGTYLGKVAGPVASVIGAIVLITIGLSTIWENIREMGWGSRVVPPGTGKVSDVMNIDNPVSLAVMAASVSLDALTAGFGLGTLQVDLTLTVITMGLVAGMMTAAGLVFGKGLNRTIGERAEILGGTILVLIGLKFLF